VFTLWQYWWPDSEAKISILHSWSMFPFKWVCGNRLNHPPTQPKLEGLHKVSALFITLRFITLVERRYVTFVGADRVFFSKGGTTSYLGKRKICSELSLSSLRWILLIAVGYSGQKNTFFH
jgi:hypothetical protein